MGLPLLGNVAAGLPTQAIPQDGYLEFNDLFGGPDHFALKVKGQSMIEDHIDDGDYVVIKPQPTAENGERVVAMIDGEVTLKKFYHQSGQVTLHPCNGTMRPIVVDPDSDARVLGVLQELVSCLLRDCLEVLHRPRVRRKNLQDLPRGHIRQRLLGSQNG